jgi:hypothetical protein
MDDFAAIERSWSGGGGREKLGNRRRGEMRWLVLLAVAGCTADGPARDGAAPDQADQRDLAVAHDLAGDMTKCTAACGCPGQECCGGVYGTCAIAGTGCLFVGAGFSCQPCGELGEPCCPAMPGFAPTCAQGDECLNSSKCSGASQQDQATVGCFNCDVLGCGNMAGAPCCQYQPDGMSCLQQGLSCSSGHCQ